MADDGDLHEKISAYTSIGAFNKDNADLLIERIKADCDDVILLRSTLLAIKDVDNSSQIYAILTADNVARVLEISDYIDDYTSLSKTTSVDKMLAGKSFDTADEFKKAFVSALNDAKDSGSETVKKPQKL